MLKVLTERFFEEPKFVLLWHPYKTPFWNLIFKSSVISVHMVFTFDNEDFVLQWTFECCIDMTWNLRPEACEEMLFNGCTQRITAPEEAANKSQIAAGQIRLVTAHEDMLTSASISVSLPALEEHYLSAEHGDSIQDQFGIAFVWGYWWCGFWTIRVLIRVWACLIKKVKSLETPLSVSFRSIADVSDLLKHLYHKETGFRRHRL